LIVGGKCGCHGDGGLKRMRREGGSRGVREEESDYTKTFLPLALASAYLNIKYLNI